MFAPAVMSRRDFDARLAIVYKPLRSHAAFAVGADLADDRLQNALLRAWKIIRDFDNKHDNAAFYNWLVKILNFEIRTFLRFESQHPETLLPPAAIFALSDGPYHMGLEAEKWCRQRAAMYRRLRSVVLSPRQRGCVERWLEGDSLAVIGAELEEPITAQAVHKIIQGVAKQLRQLDSDTDDSIILECIENLPAALFYMPPKSPWRPRPHRPDRHARTRLPRRRDRVKVAASTRKRKAAKR